jgi:alpha-L-rhamnosidase
MFFRSPKSTFSFVATLLLGTTALATEAQFREATPVWPSGREKEMNLSVGFRATFPVQSGQSAVLKIACSTVYRAWLNGQFVARGPARGPHGYYRVDELDLSGHLTAGTNIVAIEVAGYNVNSYDILDQPSFLQAEVLCGDEVAAATGSASSSFDAKIIDERVQKVQRYSFQRPFIEVYRLQPGYDGWRSDSNATLTSVDLATLPTKQLLSRRVPYPGFEVRQPIKIVSAGQMSELKEAPDKPWKDRSLVNIGPKLKGYPENELTVIPTLEIQRLTTGPPEGLDQTYDPTVPLNLAAGDYQILDLGTNLTGMLGAKLACSEPTRVWFVFDEILTDGDVDFKRLGCANIISFTCEPGDYAIEGIDPYTMRFVKVVCRAGACDLTNIYLREYKHASTEAAQFTASDERLNRLYRAGVETFRQNALDVFMDCPSRERAGWLCDSFFTARVAHDLTDNTTVETNFFENFLLPPQFAHLPQGMLPMCYPADHNDGVFIPNWSLWFVVQLDEYARRGGDPEIIRGLKHKVLELFQYFEAFENEDGLLEKLESWVFVEWSKANEFVQDVNYPSNMLYAGALGAASRIYDLPELGEKADRIRDTVRKQSFDGEFFVDHAVRRNGVLHVTSDRSEVCQYFAFFFGVASRDTHTKLWETLRDKFGPQRKQTKAHWDVHVANSFIGNVLRLELLSEAGLSQQILDESTAYLLYMADRTGTLWENDGAYASCNHGFASHVVHSLYRDVLGIWQIDSADKVVYLRFGDAQLSHCQGTIPTCDGEVRLEWSRQGDTIRYAVECPEAYRVEMENMSGCDVILDKRNEN